MAAAVPKVFRIMAEQAHSTMFATIRSLQASQESSLNTSTWSDADLTVTPPIHLWQSETAAWDAADQEQALNDEDQDQDTIVFQEEDQEQGWKEEDRRQGENPRTSILQSFKGEDFPRPD